MRKTVPDGATAEQFADFITAASQANPDVVFFGGEYNVAATPAERRLRGRSHGHRSWAATG